MATDTQFLFAGARKIFVYTPSSSPEQSFATTSPIHASALRMQLGQDHHLLTPDNRSESPLMQGTFSIISLREGLSLHCTDLLQLQDMTTQFEMRSEGVKVLLKLEGNAEVFMDSHSVPLGAGEGKRAKPQGAMVALNAPATFRRHSWAGSRQRMVVLTLTPAWFDAADLHCDFIREHLAMRSWTPTPRAISVAELLIRPEGLNNMMQKLHQESRALELAAEALTQTLTTEAPGKHALPGSAVRRVDRLKRFLDSGEADQLDMRSIALAIGCNANTLQQHFREVCGKTIFDYLRQQRLQRAAMALRQDGVSVARAAEIAGYSSQANFSTAFRRHFGLVPKHCRNRL